MPKPNGFRGVTPAGQRVDMMAEISSHDGRGGWVKSQRAVPGFPKVSRVGRLSQWQASSTPKTHDMLYHRTSPERYMNPPAWCSSPGQYRVDEILPSLPSPGGAESSRVPSFGPCLRTGIRSLLSWLEWQYIVRNLLEKKRKGRQCGGTARPRASRFETELEDVTGAGWWCPHARRLASKARCSKSKPY